MVHLDTFIEGVQAVLLTCSDATASKYLLSMGRLHAHNQQVIFRGQTQTNSAARTRTVRNESDVPLDTSLSCGSAQFRKPSFGHGMLLLKCFK